jgi:hypothetical protein
MRFAAQARLWHASPSRWRATEAPQGAPSRTIRATRAPGRA